MSFRIPEYLKESALNVWMKAGDKSKTFSFFPAQVNESGIVDNANLVKADEGNYFIHRLSFRPRPMTHLAGCETHVGLSIGLTDREDIAAFSAMFEEIFQTASAMKSDSEKASGVKISKEGQYYAFETSVWMAKLSTFKPGPDGNLVAVTNVFPEPHTNHFTIYALAEGRQRVFVGNFDLYAGMRSARLVAHDLSVLMAILSGTPERDIMLMDATPKVTEGDASGRKSHLKIVK